MAWTNGSITINYYWLWPLCVLLYIAVIALFVELNRRYYPIQIFCWVILPFIIGPTVIIYNLNNPEETESDDTSDKYATLFITAKLFTLFVGGWTIQIFRDCYTRWKESGKLTSLKIFLWIKFSLLTLNIIEAVVTDFEIILSRNSEYEWSSFIIPGNAIYGILLCFCLPNPLKMKVSDDGFRSQEWRLGRLWIINYTIWNATFVLHWIKPVDCFDINHILMWLNSIICHLGVPLLCVSWTHFDQWLQHRAFALSFYVWIWELPYLKWYLPFYRTDEKCEGSPDDALIVSNILNWICVLLGLAMFVKQIYDEIRSWKEMYDRDYDTSCIQWVVRKLCCKTRQMSKDQVSEDSDSENEAMI